MNSALLKKAWSYRSLERAWRVIEQNARTSKSEDVRREVEIFREESSKRLRSLTTRLSRGSFIFPPAKGIPFPKLGKDGKAKPYQFRPIVLASIDSRIVQRSILDALLTVDALRQYVHTPHSFGGIRKQSEDGLAAVPAAIHEVLRAIGGGANYVICADISSFFTRIPKSAVTAIVADAVQDEQFIALFSKAITVELSNMAALREKAEAFPIHDIGVAQGNSLSPLLGNILLYDFDQEMNIGDCRCIRYIDDIIILAPSKKAAIARFKRAQRLLAKNGLHFGAAKTTGTPIDVHSSFEFLGIEMSNGLIRPAAGAQRKFMQSVETNLAQSEAALRAVRKGEKIKKEHSLLATLRRVDGIVNGWGKHYRFCNDVQTMKNLDARITEMVRRYIGAYSAARDSLQNEQKRRLLGVDLLEDIQSKPFTWPKRQPQKPVTMPFTASSQSAGRITAA